MARRKNKTFSMKELKIAVELERRRKISQSLTGRRRPRRSTPQFRIPDFSRF